MNASESDLERVLKFACWVVSGMEVEDPALLTVEQVMRLGEIFGTAGIRAVRAVAQREKMRGVTRGHLSLVADNGALTPLGEQALRREREAVPA